MNAKNALGYATTLMLLGLGLFRVLTGSEFMWDAAISLVGLLLFWKLYEKTNQDIVTFSFLFIWLLIHNLGLYDQVIFLVGYDRWVHLIGGATLALIFDRWFLQERWPIAQRIMMIILLPLGIGAIHEIIEWVGFRELGHGQGFLFYGEGDFGEWRNAILDMASNLLGTCIAGIYVLFRGRVK